jgi:hypothetical protein
MPSGLTMNVQISLSGLWASVLLQKLTVAHVVKKFSPFMKARKFIVLFVGFDLSSYSVPLKHFLKLPVPLFISRLFPVCILTEVKLC